jgi:bifunctional DNase/RNase
MTSDRREKTMSRFDRVLIVWALAGLVFSAPALSVAADEPKSATGPGQVRVQNVEVRASRLGPVVLLKVENRAIPIFVDVVVAESIHGALSGHKTARPLSHDLMHSILKAFDGRVSQAIVTLKDRTFYGALTVVVQNTTRVFDSRSSDAIALAIHFKAPILVSRELLDSAGVELETPDGIPL